MPKFSGLPNWLRHSGHFMLNDGMYMCICIFRLLHSSETNLEGYYGNSSRNKNKDANLFNDIIVEKTDKTEVIERKVGIVIIFTH